MPAPIGAAVGSAKGASDAQSELVVDDTRANLRIAMQETDFGGLLRSRLATAGVPARLRSSARRLALELAMASGREAGRPGHGAGVKVGTADLEDDNPEIGVAVTVTAQATSPPKTLLDTATWTYGSPRQDFVEMGANQGAALRSEIDTAATILARPFPMTSM